MTIDTKSFALGIAAISAIFWLGNVIAIIIAAVMRRHR
jgi:hypothetical protein